MDTKAERGRVEAEQGRHEHELARQAAERARAAAEEARIRNEDGRRAIATEVQETIATLTLTLERMQAVELMRRAARDPGGE